MNKVVLMGRLTRDPEVRYTQGEHPLAVARFTLAVDRRFKKDALTKIVSRRSATKNRWFITWSLVQVDSKIRKTAFFIMNFEMTRRGDIESSVMFCATISGQWSPIRISFRMLRVDF